MSTMSHRLYKLSGVEIAVSFEAGRNLGEYDCQSRSNVVDILSYLQKFVWLHEVIISINCNSCDS